MKWSAAAAAILLSAPAPPPPPPSLLVIVAVDGLSWDRLHAWRGAFDSGFAELLREGHVAAQTNYAHLNTETCPGHASLSTGAPPRVTGIVANTWLQDGKRLYCADEKGPDGATRRGPANLEVDALGDVLGAGGRVVALSGKDRAAIMLSGRGRDHAVFWYERAAARFVTSEAYDRGAPAVAAVQALVERTAKHKSAVRWERLGPAPKVPVVSRERLAASQDPTVGPSFPHAAKNLFNTPFLDDAVADLALQVLADEKLALGRGHGIDLLALSFSANDIVAHSYGDGSEEQLDTLRRLDRQLGRLLQALRARKAGAVLLALSADHGFLPADAPPARRLRLLPKLNDALHGAAQVQGTGNWSLYLDRGAAASLRTRVQGVARELWPDAIAAVVDPSGTLPPDLARFVENARFPGRSADLMVFPRPGALAGDSARGWSHGSHLPYDTHVPLLFWGRAVAPGCSSAPAAPYDLAPTLADYAGLRLPGATGKSLRAEIARSAGRQCP